MSSLGFHAEHAKEPKSRVVRKPYRYNQEEKEQYQQSGSHMQQQNNYSGHYDDPDTGLNTYNISGVRGASNVQSLPSNGRNNGTWKQRSNQNDGGHNNGTWKQRSNQMEGSNQNTNQNSSWSRQKMTRASGSRARRYVEEEPGGTVSKYAEPAATVSDDNLNFHNDDQSINELKDSIDALKLELAQKDAEQQKLKNSLQSVIDEMNQLRKDYHQQEGSATEEIQRELHDLKSNYASKHNLLQRDLKSVESKLGVQGKKLTQDFQELNDMSYWFYATVTSDNGIDVHKTKDQKEILKHIPHGEIILLYPPMTECENDGTIMCECRILAETGQSLMGYLVIRQDAELNVNDFRLIP